MHTTLSRKCGGGGRGRGKKGTGWGFVSLVWAAQ